MNWKVCYNAFPLSKFWKSILFLRFSHRGALGGGPGLGVSMIGTSGNVVVGPAEEETDLVNVVVVGPC